jgi:hypothetical protein
MRRVSADRAWRFEGETLRAGRELTFVVPMAKRDYRAFSMRTAGPGDPSVLHLIREDAEASLCGIPRPALGPAAVSGDLVCTDCIEWLPKRQSFSGKFQRAKPT